MRKIVCSFGLCRCLCQTALPPCKYGYLPAHPNTAQAPAGPPAAHVLGQPWPIAAPEQAFWPQKHIIAGTQSPAEGCFCPSAGTQSPAAYPQRHAEGTQHYAAGRQRATEAMQRSTAYAQKNAAYMQSPMAYPQRLIQTIKNKNSCKPRNAAHKYPNHEKTKNCNQL